MILQYNNDWIIYIYIFIHIHTYTQTHLPRMNCAFLFPFVSQSVGPSVAPSLRLSVYSTLFVSIPFQSNPFQSIHASIYPNLCLSVWQAVRQADRHRHNAHAHACMNQSTCQAIYLPTVHSIPYHAMLHNLMLPVFCATHVISSCRVSPCLISCHFISSLFFLSLHLYIAWHCILLFDARCVCIIYAYMIYTA